MAITKSNERTKYELADAMKRCMKTAPVEKITVNCRSMRCHKTDFLPQFSG